MISGIQRQTSIGSKQGFVGPINGLAVFSSIVLTMCVALLLCAGSLDALITAVYAAGLAICGYFWFALTARDSNSARFCPQLFLASFAMRSFAVLLLRQVLNADTSYDASWYEMFGRQWADYWHKLTVSRPMETYPSEHLFSQIVGIQYFLSDNNIYVPLMTNAFVGSLIPTIVYDIGRRWFGGEPVGKAASIFAAVQTSMIVWSAIAMRDIYIIFFITLVIREAITMVSGLEFAAILRSAIWLAAIYAFRPYVVLFTVLAIGIAYAIVLSKKPLNKILIAFGFLSIIAAIILVGGIRTLVASVLQTETEQLDMTRQVVQFSDPHAYASSIRFYSILDVVKFLPVALYNFWGGPILIGYPIKQIMVGLVGVLSWYVTYWYALRGWWNLRRHNDRVVPLTTYIIVGSCLLSVICGNWSECVRLRSMLSVPIELMAGVGWVRRKELLLPRVTRQ